MHRLAEELIGADDGTSPRLASHDSWGGAQSIDVGELTPHSYGQTANNPGKRQQQQQQQQQQQY
jgi:hypothetical protein